MLLTTVPASAALARTVLDQAVLAQGAEHGAEVPHLPIILGVGAFLVFCAMIMGVLMFGKGRPHS